MLALAIATSAFSAPRTDTCDFKTKQFFAHIDLYTEWPYGGGVDIWNSSVFWAHDGTNQRSLFIKQNVARSLSSGPSFSHTTDQELTVDGTTYTVDKDGKCTQASGAVPTSPCTGSIVPLLPVAMLSQASWAAPAGASDAYLNSTSLDGELVDVFGWDHMCAPGMVDSMHRVYVSQATGMPVLETQGIRLACDSYAAHAMIRYSIDADSLGSVNPLFSPVANTFAVPSACGKAE